MGIENAIAIDQWASRHAREVSWTCYDLGRGYLDQLAWEAGSWNLPYGGPAWEV